ncbi:FbpB family small basic protein [Alkalicoccus daliensis]|uniref:Fur-regulated basic protein B n=1 Tax=Alkalicoccus daliensis TaxID=745820 RepID=A0A1H0DVX4_9BACI|nr:FbpB family small basic protein [Alkalicoccus daliensis]SDN74312.1 Fur-regulated basic protein B [Alkalicoccus daliensis]
MRKPIRTSFDELVEQNKLEIMQDAQAISSIEEKLDNKYRQQFEQQKD